MTRYTVKQLADLARVSIRTLHHYDEIGLLKPACLGDNGYRYYEKPQFYRLQQVLLYREFGLALDEIKSVLDAPERDGARTLRRHRERLAQRLEQQKQLLGVIDDALERMERDHPMQDSNLGNRLYNWQSPAKQADYEAWLVERYGPQAHDWIANSRQRFDALNDSDKQAAMDRLKIIETDLVEACRQGVNVEATALTPVLERHREWVGYMWNRECPPGAYANLADMYVGHPDFQARFNGMAEGFAAWLAGAMKHYAAGLGEPA